MPDLGSYAPYILGSYLGTLAIVALLVGASIRASRRAKRELERLEARHSRPSHRRRSAP
ncbi:heme exporter protein CcmD [Albimonas pacifica]|uniref:Heme exporter protein D n=1 Tax=Albimonas pacifica TaxID=1114924 RepID=A0A1I3FHY4_9RHOB|nr:heme exporter protein CcmD [Albimonas pacifica]SFI10815.1 heme exporter protein CcmD [Albimonas pacifica]